MFLPHEMTSKAPQEDNPQEETSSAVSTSFPPLYKVYKRRFWGLAQLVLLNIVVSWDVRITIN